MNRCTNSWVDIARYRVYLILLPFLAMMPSIAAAGDRNPLDFTPPESDASVKLLGKIFGLVDGVLYGTGSQMIGEVFGMFNAAILVLGAIVLIYTTIMSITNTANEGQYLGQRWNSIWIPVRSVVGVALLIPKASGYCAIQIFVMWVVIQGVGAADLIWNSALDYLQRGGVIVASNINVSTGGMSLNSATGASGTDMTQTSAVFKNSGGLFKSLVCMHSLQYALEQKRVEFMNPSVGGVDPGLVPVFFSYVRVLDDNGMPLSRVKFPPAVPGIYSQYEGVCGEVSWSNFNAQTVGAKLEASGVDVIKVGGAYSMNDPRIAAAVKARALAVGQMINDLSSSAEMVVNNHKLAAESRLPLGYWSQVSTMYGITVALPDAMWIGDASFTKPPLLTGRELALASRGYFALIQPTARVLSETLEDIDFISDAKKDGWLLAGAYFFNLALLNQSGSSFDMSNESITVVDKSASFATTNYTPLRITIPGATSDFFLDKPYIDITPLTTEGELNYKDSLEKYVNNALIPRIAVEYKPDDVGDLKPLTKIPATTIPNKHSCGDILCFSGTLKWVILTIANFIIQAAVEVSNAILGIILDPIHKMGKFFLSIVKDAFQPGKNPVIELAMFGKTLIDFAFEMVIMFMLSCLTISLLPVVGAGLALVLIILLGPMIFVAATVLVSYGAIFAFYVPIIPYMVFTFASIAWFIAVIEAMVAAPIVALGLAHPEGHDSFGKANDAIMLLANVFLRPSLMILGFVIAIILSFVTFHMVNLGFFRATKAITEPSFGIGSALAPLFIIGLYATLIMQVMQKSFDLIFLLPDRVLRWIGGHQVPGVSGQQMVGGGGADTGGGATGGAKTAVSSTAAMTGQAIESAGEAVSQMAEQKMSGKIGGKGGGGGTKEAKAGGKGAGGGNAEAKEDDQGKEENQVEGNDDDSEEEEEEDR